MKDSQGKDERWLIHLILCMPLSPSADGQFTLFAMGYSLHYIPENNYFFLLISKIVVSVLDTHCSLFLNVGKYRASCE